jgi:Lipopolysaccharide kinase (Kdo/WaaP) family
MANVRAAQAIAHNLDPAWPKPIKYFAGGVNGRVYHTNDGRLMKFVYGYAPEEFEALQKLQGTFVVPRFKKGNGLIMSLDKATSKNIKRLMFPHAPRLSEDLTVFVMGRVGGAQGMTLYNYLQAYPTANRANVQRRVEYLMSEMHMRGVSHGNLHRHNIIVSVGPTGRITGMWAIDFGRAFYHSPGKTERNAFSRKMLSSVFATPSAFSPRHTNVPVRQGSRPNTRMMLAVYGKRLSPAWEQRIARMRKQVSEEMKQYRSPTRSVKPKAKSASPRKSPSRSTRPKSAPARVSVSRKTPTRRRSVRVASLKRKRV